MPFFAGSQLEIDPAVKAQAREISCITYYIYTYTTIQVIKHLRAPVLVHERCLPSPRRSFAPCGAQPRTVHALAHHVWALCVLRGRGLSPPGWLVAGLRELSSPPLPAGAGAPCQCRGRDGAAARTAHHGTTTTTTTTSICSRAAAAGSQVSRLIKSPVSRRVVTDQDPSLLTRAPRRFFKLFYSQESHRSQWIDSRPVPGSQQRPRKNKHSHTLRSPQAA